MKISANEFQNKQGEDLSLKKCFDSAEFIKDKSKVKPVCRVEWATLPFVS